MNIDLSKLIYDNIYQIPVEGSVEVPKDLLKNTDIRSISKVNVKGYISNNDEEYNLDIVITGEMILPCARTLKDVKYPFDIEINEVIGENSDNSLKIIQNRVDIFPIIWQNILVDVPLRVLSPDAKEQSLQGDGWRLITEDEQKEEIDPRLAKLKDYYKE